MTPPNGHIIVGTTVGGGVGDDGVGIPATMVWSDKIPCRIQTVTHNNKGVYQDGKFTQSSYLLFIPMADNFSAQRVKIVRNGVDLGELEVQDVEVLNLVGRIKITV